MANPYFILVIDDERVVRNTDIPVEYQRTSREGLARLQELHAEGRGVDELWLDHDLGEIDTVPYWDTIMPVVYWLEEQGYAGTPFRAARVFIHTANASAAPQMMGALRPYYRVARVTWPGG